MHKKDINTSYRTDKKVPLLHRIMGAVFIVICSLLVFSFIMAGYFESDGQQFILPGIISGLIVIFGVLLYNGH